MTIVINDGLNEWVDHGQSWPEYWLWLPLRASDLLTQSLMAKVATDRPWLTTANHGQLVMVTSWSMMAWIVFYQNTTMTMVSIGQLLNNQLKIKNLQSDISSYYNEDLFEIRAETL